MYFKVIVLRHVSEEYLIEADDEDSAVESAVERDVAPEAVHTLYTEVTGSGPDDGRA